MRPAVFAVSALTLFLAGCSDTPPRADKAAIEKGLREVEFDMAKNVAAKDAAAFSAHYTTDAILCRRVNRHRKAATQFAPQ